MKRLVRDNRQNPRCPFDAPVRLTTADQVEVAGRSRDISVGGMFLQASEKAIIGSSVSLAFELPPLGEIHVSGFVRWVTQEGMGIQFGPMGPRETRAIGVLIRASRVDASVDVAR